MFPLSRSLFHCLFATKDGEPLLTPEIRERLWPYFDEIARTRSFKVVASGGGNDHVHLLLSLSSAISISKAVQILKGESAIWINHTFPAGPQFRWQQGYGAFSIGIAALAETCAYIRNQGSTAWGLIETSSRALSRLMRYLSMRRRSTDLNLPKSWPDRSRRFWCGGGGSEDGGRRMANGKWGIGNRETP